MTTHYADRTLERYVREYANDPEFLAEGLAISVAEEIVSTLRERKLTQSWLAATIGVSRSQISRILNAPPNLTLLSITRIAVALGVRADVTLNAEARLTVVQNPAPSSYEDYVITTEVNKLPAETAADSDNFGVRRTEKGAITNAIA